MSALNCLETARAEFQRQHSTLLDAVAWTGRMPCDEHLRLVHHIGIVESTLREFDLLIADARRAHVVSDHRIYQEHPQGARRA